MENVQAAFFISAAASAALVCAAARGVLHVRNLRGILQLLKRQISPH
jgi:hypothetical protein